MTRKYRGERSVEDKNQTKSQSNIPETSTSVTSFGNAQMSHIPVTSRVYNLMTQGYKNGVNKKEK